ncbi:MerR family transcriptional regulator [Amycolatopsis sp. DSM 110486]|uniref:MerR family transcriptional regulator n=1 Tax=Amycolatopsis sp. DSM 110486 TaxID=2865832 RepID=UPI001C696CC9|nr:MerR family transcriptional regulator [Amycolatopsis sp. DSM 110486]QYN19655.1 MerR family transcriptional regulator [Amycolatopsis sp. DSM 110486]
MTSLRISQLAARTGVPATTLRFYETAGLLPAERTTAGYRVYGQEAVQRLAFISSAKVLGLPLEEIRDLLGVWEQGVCAAVRARMLPLLAERIADADRRQAELAAFSARLTEVHQQLSTPAPAGGCGPDCGCTATTTGPGPVPVPLSRTYSEETAAGETAAGGTAAETWRQAPVACTLESAALGERIAQWQRITGQATSRRDTADGLTLILPATPELAAEVAALAAAEQDCCAFFDFTLHLTPTALELTVRAPEAAGALLAELFAVSA